MNMYLLLIRATYFIMLLFFTDLLLHGQTHIDLLLHGLTSNSIGITFISHSLAFTAGLFSFTSIDFHMD